MLKKLDFCLNDESVLPMEPLDGMFLRLESINLEATTLDMAHVFIKLARISPLRKMHITIAETPSELQVHHFFFFTASEYLNPSHLTELYVLRSVNPKGELDINGDAPVFHPQRFGPLFKFMHLRQVAADLDLSIRMLDDI